MTAAELKTKAVPELQAILAEVRGYSWHATQTDHARLVEWASEALRTPEYLEALKW